jgi:hypothetical protein
MDYLQATKAIEDGIESINSVSWASKLTFKCAVVSGTSVYRELQPSDYEMRDLFEYTHDKYYNWKIYFDISTYPFAPGGWQVELNKNTTKQLHTDIMIAAMADGNCKLVSNGSNSSTKSLCCQRFRTFQKREDKENANYRSHTLSYNRENQRKNGKTLSRKTASLYPTANETKCPAKLVFGIDDYGVFLKGGCGTSFHLGHQPCNNEYVTCSNRLQPPVAAAFAKAAATCNVRPGQTAKLIYEATGVKLTRRQVAHHQGISQRACRYYSL